MNAAGSKLRKTPLYELHRELGARFVPFAGYEMPLQYGAGIVKEHTHVRGAAGLFDVSHMGQAHIEAPSFEIAAAALEKLVPGDILGLKPGRMRYTQLLNRHGGILDDLMATRDASGEGLSIVVNASRKDFDFDFIRASLPAGVTLTPRPNDALLALQGPKAAEALARLLPDVSSLAFLEARPFPLGSQTLAVSRSGYTGEDGFEIALSGESAEAFARQVLSQPEVLPAGLGARDTLRLEAGLPLYAQDMDETTSPVEAALAFSIGKRRRLQGCFPGAARIQKELQQGPDRLRAGLRLDGRAAARSGMDVLDEAGSRIGKVTSGAFTPTAAASIAMAYVPQAFGKPGTQLAVDIRGTPVPAKAVQMPFVPHRYFRQIREKV